MRIKKRRTYLILILVLAVLLIILTGILVVNKKIKIAPLFARKFEVIGVDVSHYQGNIDWPVLVKQDLDFVFIKATEGSGYVDRCFYDNWREAEKTDLYVGAYHFFSFDSDGRKQAQFYMDTVGSLDGKLAPVIDVEFYGDKEKNPPPKEEVVIQLRKLLEMLEECYQVKPIIYTTYSAYQHYIRDEFTGYPLWIRNVYYQPFLMSGETWSFWQYTDTAVLDGYQGSEKYIDMNVFQGTREELQKMTVWCEEECPKDKSEPEEPESFRVWDEATRTEEEILLEHCNLVYDAEQVKVYSYLGMSDLGRKDILYILTSEQEMLYHVRNFWMDEEREVLWFLENKDDMQLREMNFGEEHFLEETLLLDGNGFESLIVATYGLSGQANQTGFGNLYVDLSCQKENGEILLGGRASFADQETGRMFEIVYEIDKESGKVSARGYLQDLAIAPLYQEFLMHNLTVENPSEIYIELGQNLGFFDDEVYLAKAGAFYKQFAVVDSENAEPELLFRMCQTEGKEEWVYVLTQERDRLICTDVVKLDSQDDLKDRNEEKVYQIKGTKWLDCASFLEIPIENCEKYLSREEVFTAIEKGDFSVVVRKYSDPESIVKELEMVYETSGGSSRTVRSDIDEDGMEELLFLIKYDFEEYERIEFILDYRNGRAVCIYLDWCDGNEWLVLSEAGKLIHCLFSSNGWCTYYGFHECALNARDIKALDCLGNGIEICDVYQFGEPGLWWWEGQQPEITQAGIYYTRSKGGNTEDGTGEEFTKELISKEAFQEAFTELTGEEQIWSKIVMDIKN